MKFLQVVTLLAAVLAMVAILCVRAQVTDICADQISYDDCDACCEDNGFSENQFDDLADGCTCDYMGNAGGESSEYGDDDNGDDAYGYFG